MQDILTICVRAACVRGCQNAMVSTVDETAANVSAALKRTGLWAETLLVWSTDNGSPVQVAGSNAPLKGGKGSNWEGGCRVPAFVTGGFLPAGQRGKSYTAGLAHIIDWYRTFALLAGGDPLGDQDTAPAPLASLDLWPWLSGQAAESPRNEIIYDHRMNSTDKLWNTSGLPGYASGALRVGDWKLLVGPQKQASWYGHFTPNASACGNQSSHSSEVATILSSTAAAAAAAGKESCQDISQVACEDQPCLFNVGPKTGVGDKSEHVDLASAQPAVLAKLLARWSEISRTYHPPPNPNTLEAEYCAGIAANRGFVAPWLH